MKHSLHLQKDSNDIYRSSSRISNAKSLSYDAKNPIILCRNHRQQDNKSLRKFISCRGCTGKILTDNGTVFTSQETQKFAANRNIEWQFSFSNAPWRGGFWERPVSIAKRCLEKAIGKACLNFYELQIILSEIEIIINSRPLDMLYDVGMYEVMTPNHLLFGRKLYQENPNWEMHEVMAPNHLLFARKLYQENPN